MSDERDEEIVFESEIFELSEAVEAALYAKAVRMGLLADGERVSGD